jgi:hypothetical protein
MLHIPPPTFSLAAHSRSCHKSGMKYQEALALADGLHIELLVQDGILMMTVDADPRHKSALHHVGDVLRIAAADLDKRALLGNTLPRPSKTRGPVN